MSSSETSLVFDLGDDAVWMPDTRDTSPQSSEMDGLGPCVVRLLHNYAVQYLRAQQAGISDDLLIVTAIMGGGRAIERAARPHELSTAAYVESARLFEDFVARGGSVETLLCTIDERNTDEPEFEILPVSERRID